MHIVIIPASTKTGQATIRTLLADAPAPTVTGVYRDVHRAPAEFIDNPRFTAVQGDVTDAKSLLAPALDCYFERADAVATITPPLHNETDPIAKAREAALNVKQAVSARRASAKRLVYISSVGAQLEHGTGEIGTNHEAEQALLGAAPEVIFVRCAYFMENWAVALATLKEDSPFFYSAISPADCKVPMVSVSDVGRICAAQLLGAGSAPGGENPSVSELHGPESYSTRDV
ncbi:hypothetical protein PG996_004660 [Apiospora saccharicola]|uniref:NAD(P)-binding domain-containing protein n=1 Tax=Apiospora saccharicola TaxID=335842 RepID=A0ABR1W4Q5_9PEZI